MGDTLYADGLKASSAGSESLERFRDVFLGALRSSDVWMWEIDAAGRIVFSAGPVERLFGFSNDALLGKDLPALFAPEDSKLVEDALSSARASKASFSGLEVYGSFSNGRKTSLLLSGSPVITGTAVLGFRGVAEDIASAALSKETLLHEKAWFEKVISIIPVVVVGLGEKSRIIIFNEYAEKLTGYSAKEVVGKQWIDLFIPKDRRDEMHSVFDKIVRTRVMEHEYENPILTKSGESRLIFWHNVVILHKDGSFKSVLSVGEDITRTRRAESSLQEVANRYRLVTSQTGQLLYDYDLRSGRIDWFGAIKELTGYDEGFFRKIDISAWFELIHPDDRTSAIKTLSRAQESGSKYASEYRFKAKHGWVYLHDEGVFTSDPAGVPLRLIGAMRDITGQKQTEAELMRWAEQLEKFNKLAVGRELKMIELKKRIKSLEAQLATHKPSPEGEVSSDDG
ncbi:PAS domain S-box protein [Candidatus Woesearchaeota archaeon]|nr:PAS domain S-box protein [Candidatus Woesearchaeota archaeon]